MKNKMRSSTYQKRFDCGVCSKLVDFSGVYWLETTEIDEILTLCKWKQKLSFKLTISSIAFFSINQFQQVEYFGLCLGKGLVSLTEIKFPF